MRIDEFKESLHKVGFSQADFCRATGLAFNTISLWNKKGETPYWVDGWMELYSENQMLRAVLRKAGVGID